MKKTALLIAVLALACTSCLKTPVPETYADASLEGTSVDLSMVSGLEAHKVFVLNEGQMGTNNATLDVLRTSDASYISGAFRKMNPSLASGLGDVGNAIAVQGDEVWMVLNNSGIVEVVSAKDEKEITAIAIPTPRSIALDSHYAYVTSWAGAFVEGIGYENPKGLVYRIDISKKKVIDSVEVGYQPEGIAVSGDFLYVANSGGIASQIPPLYAYDNTVSVIERKTFQLSKTLQVQDNLKDVFADTKGNVYVTSLGNYYNVHSSLYRLTDTGIVSRLTEYVSVAALSGDTVYCIGTEQEYEWSNPSKTWEARAFSGGSKVDVDLAIEATTPYGLCVIGDNAFLLGDAGDYFNPGTVSLYAKGQKQWSVTAGVCPGHFAIW